MRNLLTPTLALLAALTCCLACAQEVEWTQTFEMDEYPALTGWLSGTAIHEVNDGVLRLVDPSSERGSGASMQVHWEADPEVESIIEARMKLVSVDGAAGVVIWACDGTSEEGIQFQPDGINLAFAKLSCEFDTDDDFHVYRVVIKGNDLKLFADGELIIDAAGKYTHPAHSGRNRVSFGCVSSNAKGESLWDYVKFRSAMRVQVGKTPPEIEHVTIFREDDTYAVFPSIRHDPETDRLSTSFRAGGPKSHINALGAGRGQFASEDGGKTWGKGPAVPGKGFTGPDGRRIGIGCKWWQEFPDTERKPLEEKGYAVRDVRPGIVAICAGVYKRISDDDGKTWAKEDIDVPFTASLASGMNSLQMQDGTIIFPVYGLKRDGGPDSCWVLRSEDYGDTWEFIEIATHPNGTIHLNGPFVVELESGRLLVVMRTGVGSDHLWQTVSDDGGKTWKDLKDTGVKGHPPDLLQLHDGRILLSYGYRHPKFGIRAVVSNDNGDTWDLDNVWVLREDGGGVDLGYPHSVQLKDETVVTIYYFHEPKGMQYIACTRWKVPK